MHRLIGELLALVPQGDEPWPRPARERWLAALAAVVDVVYEDDDTAAPSPLRTVQLPLGVERAPSQSPAQAPAASPFTDGPRPGDVREQERGFLLPRSGEDARLVDLRAEASEAGVSRGRHARRPTVEAPGDLSDR